MVLAICYGCARKYTMHTNRSLASGWRANILLQLEAGVGLAATREIQMALENGAAVGPRAGEGW